MVQDQRSTTEERERGYANLLRQEKLRDTGQQMYAPDFGFAPSMQQDDRINSPEKERKASAQLRREKQASRGDNAGKNLANNDSYTKRFGKQGENNKDEKEQESMRRMNMAQHVARAAELGLRLSGQGELADDIGDIADTIEDGEDDSGAGPGMVRKFASNKAGSGVQKLAGKKGLTGGRSAALGGAVASALQGEGVGGIAKGALSWYLLNYAFGALASVVGSIPALIYLDFHYVMSKLGSKIFGEMFLWQKLVLLFANIIVIIAIMIIVVFIVIMVNPCLLVDSIGTWWANLFGAVCKAV